MPREGALCGPRTPFSVRSGKSEHACEIPRLLFLTEREIQTGVMLVHGTWRVNVHSQWDSKSYSGSRCSAFCSDPECSLAPPETLDKFLLIALCVLVGGLRDDDPAQFTSELGDYCSACNMKAPEGAPTA
jgi:hypothetical protein